MSAKAKIGMVFGVFDGLHEGHEVFLRQTQEHAEHLIVVVATNESVLNLKGVPPHTDIQERIIAIQNFLPRAEVLVGDAIMGSYDVIKKEKPELILLGYDQTVLKIDLENKIMDATIPPVKILVLKPHRPDEFHSSIMSKK